MARYEIIPLKFFTFEKKFSNLSVAVSPGEDCPHEKRIATTGGFLWKRGYA